MTAAVDRVSLTEVRDLLQVGQALPFRVLDLHDRLLLNEGHLLADEAQFEALVERGAWAERPVVEAARAALAASTGAQGTSAPPPTLFDRWERWLWHYDKCSRALVRHELSASALQPLHASLIELIDRDQDVALFGCVRQEDRRFALYPLTHALHCAVVVTLAGRQLKWSDTQVASIGCAALTMNLPLLELQARMAEQTEPPSKRQLDQIRAHPQAAAELLQAAGVTDEPWLRAVAEHHEQQGGGGYPRGLQEVGDIAQLLRAADVYMAKISPRAQRAPMSTQLAMRQLFQQRPGDPLAMGMVKTLGVYPPGSLVQLQSGEVAVVIRRPTVGTQPWVATLSDTRGKPSGQTQRRDTSEPGFGVLGPLQDLRGYERVLPERVYGVLSV